MPHLAVSGPLEKGNLHHDLGLYPVSPDPRQAGCFREGSFGDLDRVQSPAQLEQQLRIEPRADFSREHEIVSFVVANEQRAEPDTSALWLGKSTDDELLAGLAFHFQPVLRPAVLVRRVATLRDHALPALGARAFP